MQINGDMIIGRRSVRGAAGSVHAIDPARHATLEPAFGLASGEELASACALAEGAFDSYRALPLERRAAFLEAIAARILDLGPALIERASLESGLPQAPGRRTHAHREPVAPVRQGGPRRALPSRDPRFRPARAHPAAP